VVVETNGEGDYWRRLADLSHAIGLACSKHYGRWLRNSDFLASQAADLKYSIMDVIRRAAKAGSESILPTVQRISPPPVMTV
jgi:hypothetical protein